MLLARLGHRARLDKRQVRKLNPFVTLSQLRNEQLRNEYQNHYT
jgi:hypothetical protein